MKQKYLLKKIAKKFALFSKNFFAF